MDEEDDMDDPEARDDIEYGEQEAVSGFGEQDITDEATPAPENRSSDRNKAFMNTGQSFGDINGNGHGRSSERNGRNGHDQFG